MKEKIKKQKNQKEKLLPLVKWSEKEWQEASRKLNEYSKEDEENLIQWLEDAEQLKD